MSLHLSPRSVRLQVRRHFFYHGDAARPGAVRQLIHDMCSLPKLTDQMSSAIAQAHHAAPPQPGRGRHHHAASSVATLVGSLGYPSKEELYARRMGAADHHPPTHDGIPFG